jgi:hypothetical protein
MNGWRGLNMLSNHEESTIRNENALLWLLAYSPQSKGGQRLPNHPILLIDGNSWVHILSPSDLPWSMKSISGSKNEIIIRSPCLFISPTLFNLAHGTWSSWLLKCEATEVGPLFAFRIEKISEKDCDPCHWISDSMSYQKCYAPTLLPRVSDIDVFHVPGILGRLVGRSS